jgi:hypothetical protein
MNMIAETLQGISTAAQQMSTTGGPAYAATVSYLDPGTGSLIIQVAIGAFVGGLVGVKLFWKRITGSFARVFQKVSRSERIGD